MNLRDAWRYTLGQRGAFVLLNFYVFLEYIRPQAIVDALSVLPWSSATLALAWVFFLLDRRALRLDSIITWLLFTYTAVLLASSAFAIDPKRSLDRLSLYLLWVPFFLLVVSLVTDESKFLTFVFGWILWNAKMSVSGARQWVACGFCYRKWGVLGSPGWFGNSGEFAIEMCIFAAVLVFIMMALWKHWPRWKQLSFIALLGTAVMSIIGAASRGGLLGLATVGLCIVYRTKYKVRGVLLIGAAAVLVWLATPDEFKARFETVGADATSVSRSTYRARGWEIAKAYPVLGIGYGNWLLYYQLTYRERGHEPHNVFVQAVAELGFLGLGTFLALVLATFYVNWRTRRLVRAIGPPANFLVQMSFALDAALVAFLVTGYFVTVLYYPYFWVNIAMTVALANAAKSLVARSAALALALPGREEAEDGRFGRQAADVSRARRTGAFGWRSRRNS